MVLGARAAAAALAIATAVAAMAISVAPASATGATHQEQDAAVLPRLHAYSASGFTGPASTLPKGLKAAVTDQLGMSPAEFLASGATAADAARVLAALRSRGIDVLGSRLDGTALKVYVPDRAEAADVTETGATAIVGRPAAKPADPQLTAAASVLASGLHGGTGYYLDLGDQGEAVACSVGFNGYDSATGASEFVTAGHCDAPQQTGYSPNGPARTLGTSARDGSLHATGTTELGTPVAGSFQYGDGADSGLIALAQGIAAQPDVTTWGDGANRTESGPDVPIAGASAGVVGAPVCRSGFRSGWQCGRILAVDETANISGEHVNTVTTSACSQEGDSGGPYLMGEFAIGTLSGSNWPDGEDLSPAGCTPSDVSHNDHLAEQYLAGDLLDASSLYISAVFPLVSASGRTSIESTQPGWQLAVSLPEPAVTAASDTQLSGTVAANPSGGVQPDEVIVTVDGVELAAPVPVVNGSWTAALPAGTPEGYGFTVAAASSSPSYSWSRSLAASGSEYALPSTPTAVFGYSPRPTISGAVKTGRTLTAHVPAWTPAATAYTYRWYASGKAIAGATRPAFTPTSAQYGKRITVAVTGTAAGFATTTETSAAATVKAGVLTKATPRISGTPQVGRTLTARPGSWGPGKVALRYRWYAGGKAIKGATRRTLVLGWTQRGKHVTVRVTGRESGYKTGHALSGRTRAVG